MNRGPAGQRRSLRGSLQRLLGRLVFAWVGSAVLGGVPGPAHAAETVAPEFQFKAAFIYHFAQFVEWPSTAFADAKAPFVIGILGENPFGDYLRKAVEGKSLNEHPLMVKRFSSAAEALKAGVQILFIDASEKEHFAEITKALQGASILTVVNQLDHFLGSGFMINFIAEGKKIRFQINDKAAESAHLKISAKLLSLASRATG